jgi:iron(III) transport system substrate-binding protein
MKRIEIPRGLRRWLVIALGLVAAAIATACGRCRSRPVVVVYVAVDQAHAEPVLARFERETGIEVRAVYDVEATKSTGLAQKILAEKSHPQADVFWNGGLVQTLQLGRAGALASYRSPSARDLPAEVVDPAGLWAGQAGRMRVLLVDAALAPGESPSAFMDLLRSPIPAGQIGLAHPVFGTSAAHAAALYALLGPERGRELYEQVRAHGVRIPDGNSVVRNLVSRHELRFGFVDTDDACAAVLDKAPVRVVVPDQGEGQWGALVIPTTVGLLAGAPHAEQGRVLVDYLLSREVEAMLMASGWSHAPYRSHETAPPCFDVRKARRMAVTPAQVGDFAERAHGDMRAIFVR